MCYTSETNNSSGGPDLLRLRSPNLSARAQLSASGDRYTCSGIRAERKFSVEGSGHLSGIRSRDQRDGGDVATPHRRRACRVSCRYGGKRHTEGHSLGGRRRVPAQSRRFSVYPERWRPDSSTMPPSRGRQTSSRIVIFCALQVNVRHARRIARRCGAPIPVARRGLARFHCHATAPISWHRAPASDRRERASRLVSTSKWKAVAFSNPQEIPELQASAGMHYLAWPHPRWSAPPRQKREARALDTVVHVGSLYRMEGCRAPG